VATYGHLIPGANISFVDRLDEIAKPADETRPQQSTTRAQQRHDRSTAIPSEVVDLIGGGAWTRTTDLRIMSQKSAADSTQLQQDSSADSGKVLQNPQPPRNKKLADD
jgi:hypothetical protein